MERNDRYIIEWAKSNAILVDYIDSYGSPMSEERIQESMKERRKEEGKYTTNAGVTAFVVSGHCYATPLVEEASRVLESAGFEYTSNIWVPFGTIGAFPGALSSETERKLWFRDNGELVANPAYSVRRYYEEIVRIHHGYNNWVRLLKKKGTYRKETDPILYRIKVLWEDQDGYNEYARREAERMRFERESKNYK